jgi:hypothetical protein
MRNEKIVIKYVGKDIEGGEHALLLRHCPRI